MEKRKTGTTTGKVEEMKKSERKKPSVKKSLWERLDAVQGWVTVVDRKAVMK